MRKVLIVVMIVGSTCGWWWQRTPVLQVETWPPRGAHIEWRKFPAAGYTLSVGRGQYHKSMALPEGTYVLIPVMTRTRQEDFYREDSLFTVSR
jgi:hypothetical protein